MFGGNSNWRGPVWMPVQCLDHSSVATCTDTYYGNGFIVECPTGSGRQMTLYQVAEELARRLSSISCETKAAAGRCMAGPRSFSKIHIGVITSRFTNTFMAIVAPDWEASHQTGWTGLIASMMHLFSSTTAEQALELEKWP